MKKSFMTRALATGLSLAMACSLSVADVSTAAAASLTKVTTKTITEGKSTKVALTTAAAKKYKIKSYKLTATAKQFLKAEIGTAKKAVTITAKKNAVTNAGATQKNLKITLNLVGKKDASVKKTAKVNVVVKAKPEVALTMNADVTGVKKVTVSFNKAVDTAKAQITLKKGVTTVNASKVSFTDDKTAVIETAANLTKGDYTVEVTGLSDAAMTDPVVVADDEYVHTIKITTTDAPLLGMNGTTAPGTAYIDNKTIKISYELQNQYDEVVANVSTLPTFTASTGTTVAPSDISYKNGSGTVYVQSSNVLVPNSDVFINAVLVNGTHVASANTSVKVALPAKFDKAEFLGVYNTRTKKVETISAATLDKYNRAYYLLFSMVDQYGNGWGAKDDTAANIGFSVASQNPVFVGVDQAVCKAVEYQDKTYQAVQLVGGTYADKGGTAVISIISSGTGTTSTCEINSDASAAVEKFTLQTPSDIVTLGSTVEIPFEAVDQNGNAVTAFDSLDGKVDFTSGNAGISMFFKKQSDGTAKLFITVAGSIRGVSATQELLVYSSSVVKSNGNFSSTTYSVKNGSIPTTVVGLAKTSGIATTFTNGAADQTLKLSDLNIADQYGRTMSTADVKKQLSAGGKVVYAVKVASEQAIELNTATNGGVEYVVANGTTDGLTIGSATTGTAKVVFGIKKQNTSGTWVQDPASEKEIRFTAEGGALGAYDSYEVAALPTLYLKTNGAAPVTTGAVGNYAVDVKVYGVAADGSKILLPSSQFTVSLPGWGIGAQLSVADNRDGSKDSIGQIGAIAPATVASNKWFWTGVNDSTYKDETIDVTVTIFDTNGAQKASKTEKLTVSNKDPKVKVAKFTGDVNATTNTAYIKQVSNGIVTASLTAIIDAGSLKDQYGVSVPTVSPTAIVISDVKEASDQDGQTFTVTGGNTASAAVSGAVKNDTFKVTFKYDGGCELSCDVVVTD